MKKRGHYCKVCGEYKANEKFSVKSVLRSRQKSRRKE